MSTAGPAATTGPSGSGGATDPEAAEQRSVLASSAVMAAGTVFSRMSGFVRSVLLAAALGLSLHAEVFTIANTVPTMLYILLAGGVFNAVLVPQLVRAMREDPDGGEAFTNRVVTWAAALLGVATVALTVGAPLVMSLYLDSQWSSPELAAHRDSIVALARWCLPQVFFYAMFVLVGQVLNARRRFGPMMWAPIANNVVSVGVLVLYLLTYGPARGAEVRGAYSDGQEALLGAGSTLGIAVQLLVLVPYLRAAGFSFRPRLTLRAGAGETGLGRTLRLGLWTVLFVVVNQIAYTVVVRLASGGTLGAADGTGYTIYTNAFLVVMLPHSVITVSLATAVLPSLAASASAGDLAALGRSLAATLRTALAVIVPFVVVLPLVAPDVAQVLFGHGAAAQDAARYAPSLALFGPGLLLFTVHYLVLRGFYALELTRTVFLIQCAVAATNIVAALLLVTGTGPARTAPALIGAYAASYLVGACLSYAVLRRRLGTLGTRQTLRYAARLAAAVAPATAAAGGVALALGFPDQPGHWLLAAGRMAAVGGTAAVVLVGLARPLGLTEITQVLETLTRRLPGRSRPTGEPASGTDRRRGS